MPNVDAIAGAVGDGDENGDGDGGDEETLPEPVVEQRVEPKVVKKEAKDGKDAKGKEGWAFSPVVVPKAKAKTQSRKRRIEELVKDSDDEPLVPAEAGGLLTQKN